MRVKHNINAFDIFERAGEQIYIITALIQTPHTLNYIIIFLKIKSERDIISGKRKNIFETFKN